MKRKNRFSLYMLGLISFLSLFAKTQAASFDCAKATTSMERLICSNDYVSELDAELGQEYKKALIKYTDKKDVLIQQQRNWIKWIRSQCKDSSCLVTLYEARIGELIGGNNVVALNGPDKPNFILTNGRGTPLCEEYLRALNSTAKEDLRACKLPDLSKSAVKPVDFKPLTGEKLITIDKIVYEQNGGGPWMDWEQKWPEREKEYADGLRLLGVAQWDLDKDGNVDEVFEEAIPYSRCILPSGGLIENEWKKIDSEWKLLSSSEKNIKAKQYGYKRFYSLIKDGKLIRVSADRLINFDGNYISVSHAEMNNINTSNEWADKNWITILGVGSKLDSKGHEYRETSSVCKFWFNK